MNSTPTYQIERTSNNRLRITQVGKDTSGIVIDCSEVLGFISVICAAAKPVEDRYKNTDQHSDNTWRVLPDGSSELVDDNGKVLATVPPNWMDELRIADQAKTGRQAAVA